VGTSFYGISVLESIRVALGLLQFVVAVLFTHVVEKIKARVDQYKSLLLQLTLYWLSMSSVNLKLTHQTHSALPHLESLKAGQD